MKNLPDPRCYAAARDTIAAGHWSVDLAAGEITSNRWGNRRIGFRNPRGYYMLPVKVDGKKRTVGAHRVIWEFAFGPIDDPELVINHINGNPSDNRIDNLELVSQRANIDHAVGMGLVSRGVTRPMAKLTDVQVQEIREAVAAGETTVALGERYGVHSSTISRAARGERWRHVGADR